MVCRLFRYVLSVDVYITATFCANITPPSMLHILHNCRTPIPSLQIQQMLLRHCPRIVDEVTSNTDIMLTADGRSAIICLGIYAVEAAENCVVGTLFSFLIDVLAF